MQFVHCENLEKQHSPENAVFLIKASALSKACILDHVFSIKSTITAILMCLLAWLHTENRFQDVCLGPKIAQLNGGLLVCLPYHRLYTVSTLSIQISSASVNIVSMQHFDRM